MSGLFGSGISSGMPSGNSGGLSFLGAKQEEKPKGEIAEEVSNWSKRAQEDHSQYKSLALKIGQIEKHSYKANKDYRYIQRATEDIHKSQKFLSDELETVEKEQKDMMKTLDEIEDEIDRILDSQSFRTDSSLLGNNDERHNLYTKANLVKKNLKEAHDTVLQTKDLINNTPAETTLEYLNLLESSVHFLAAKIDNS